MFSSGRLLWPFLVALTVSGLFWFRSFPVARGWFPAPLDDVYIHFDFARAMAEGHPFEWIGGQGYSSGETSPLYAVVLAMGWLVGFRGKALGVWAAVVTILSIAQIVRAVWALVRPAPPWLAAALTLLPLSLGLLDWTLASGMEMALFTAVLASTVVALERTRGTPRERGGQTRERRQWIVGAWGALLCLLRPEAGVLVFVFAIATARGAGPRSAIAAILRSALPGALATLAVLAANLRHTGTAQSAGAQLKLLSSLPYLSPQDRAHAFVENLVVFFVKGVFELGISRLAALLLVVFVAAACTGRARRTAATCIVGSVFYMLLVSWNSNAPFHNFRYYAPTLLLLTIAAAMGIARIAQVRRFGKPAAGIALALSFGLLWPKIPAQMRHYRAAVGNIRDQQIEAGLRLRDVTDPSARILVGDAGAIPFVSGRTAIDVLGLGGYHGMPFARAAVFGEGAMIELIERLPANERPSHLALYPNWFPEITRRFGVEFDRVTLAENVICGGLVKGLYRADWSTLEGVDPDARDPNVIDELDVADVVSEREHGYVPPLPHGGYVTIDVKRLRDRGARFDAGRVIPEGAQETFVVRKAPDDGHGFVVVRVDDGADGLRLRTRTGDVPLILAPLEVGSWRVARAEVRDLAKGDVLTLHGGRTYVDHHVWITRAEDAP